MSAGDGWLQGIDVSKWQPTTPDLTGVHFLIARRGIGTKLDATYDTHIAAARKAGIVTGSYWYNIGSLPVSDEVNAYIASEGDVGLHVIDWEGTDGFTAAQTAQFISLYKQRTGNRIALYASESRFRDLGQDWDWIANYSQEPTKHFNIWQYGPYHGADGNLFRGTMSDLRALIGDPTVIPAAITDQTPKQVRVSLGANLYDVDGTTVLRKTTAALDWRPSPYGVGTKRAIFSPDPPIVLVSVGATNIRDLPPVIETVTVDATDAQINAAMDSQKVLDDARQKVAVEAATKAEHDRISEKLGHLAD